MNTASHVIPDTKRLCQQKDSQLPALLKNTIENLQENSLQIEEVLADGGYSSGESLQALEDNHIEGYIPNFGQYKASREGFTYDKENDRNTCSRGIHLPFKKLTTTSLGYQMKVYPSQKTVVIVA